MANNIQPCCGSCKAAKIRQNHVRKRVCLWCDTFECEVQGEDFCPHYEAGRFPQKLIYRPSAAKHHGNGRSRVWTDADESELKRLWPIHTRSELCAILERSYAAIAVRASRLGLCNHHRGGRPKGSKQLSCCRGHPLTDDNIYAHGDSRQCKTCNLEHARRARKRKKVAA
jgi:hypothetical protein